jgi:N-methylhydantoinase B
VDGGGGAFPFDDGPNALMFLGNGDAPNTPIEILEAGYPLRFLRYTFNPVNRGVGQYRGGYGVIREFMLLEDDAELQTSTENNFQPLWGLAGGGNAGTSMVYISGPNRPSLALDDRVSEFGPMQAGDVISMHTANGGGWGDPRKRDVKRIAQDVLNGMIDIDEAVKAYGADRSAINDALIALRERAA